MEIVVTTLSIALQFVAAIVALQIAIQSRRFALLPLALAILLMGIRRSFSLYTSLAFERPINVGAETIALTISALMVVGLVGLRRWILIDESSTDQRRSKIGFRSEARGIVAPRLAILLGVAAIVASCATSYFTFLASRNAMRETIIQGHLSLAQAIAQHANTLPTTSNALIEKLTHLWRQVDHPSANAYLCVVRSDGKLLLHTSRSKIIGINVGHLPIETGRVGGPKTLRALVAVGDDWVGDFTFLRGNRRWRHAPTYPNSTAW